MIKDTSQYGTNTTVLKVAGTLDPTAVEHCYSSEFHSPKIPIQQQYPTQNQFSPTIMVTKENPS